MTDDATPPAQHLDLDQLADALAGELADRSHLDTCASCAHRLAELEAAEVAVVASLATLPDPALPDGLADRLAAALRGEPALTAAAAPAGATVTPLAPRRRAWLPAAAAAAALVMAGALGISALDGVGGSDDADTASTAAGEAGAAADSTGVVRNDRGTDYADEAAVTAALPAVLAGTASDAAFTAAAPAPAVGGTAPGDSTASAQTGAGATELSRSSADPLERLRDPAALADCLTALLPPEDPDARPLAIDYATYGGTPALAVVLPDPDPAKLSVFVVGAGCSQADDSTLHFVRVDKP